MMKFHWLVGLVLAQAAASSALAELPNGVAAGDVDQTSAILWTRSASEGTIRFLYGTNREFVDATEILIEQSEPMIPVKVEVVGLEPGTRYYYRAKDRAGARADGTFRTPANPGIFTGLRFGVSGDWRGELRPYPSISNLPARRLDFFVALGDTVYADIPSIDFPGVQARTLDEFRIKHNEVYSKRYGINSWKEARASTPIYATIDDHEVTNDFVGGAPPATDLRFDANGAFINETDLFTNGLQVFQEYNPLRNETYGDTGERLTANKQKLYRYRTFGSDAAMILLDARSFRSPALAEIQNPLAVSAIREFHRDSFDPTRTLLGAPQLEDLLADLLASQNAGITWKFVLVPEPIQNLGPILASDRFEGYAYERSVILKFIDEKKIDNVVFIAADIHGTIVNNLTYQRSHDDIQRALHSFEITTGAVAYAAPFGPTVVAFAPPPLTFLFGNYAGFGRGRQNAIIQGYSNILLKIVEYSRIGLAGSPLDARLCRGDYLAVNTYGWTEFEIDANSQDLLVTTWGVDWYSRSELESDPDDVIDRVPAIVSQFLVHPRNLPEPQDRAEVISGQNEIEVERFPCPPPSRPCGAIGMMPIWNLLLFGACLLMQNQHPRKQRR